MLNKIIRRCSRYYWELIKRQKAFDRRKLSIEDYLDEIKSEKIKNEMPRLLVSIDDLSMTRNSLLSYDRGGDEGGILEQIVSTIEIYDWLRPIFFIIPKNREVLDGRNIFCSPFDISSLKHPRNYERVLTIKELRKKGYFDIGMHGLYHKQFDRIGYHPYAEFEFSDNLSDHAKLKHMVDVFDLLDLQTPLFKPPAFGVGCAISKEIVKTLSDINGITHAFLSTPNNGLNTHSFNVSHINETKLHKITNVPQNINLLWSEGEIVQVVQNIIEKNGIVHPQCHCVEPGCLEDGWSDFIVSRLKLIESIMSASTRGYKIWKPST